MKAFGDGESERKVGEGGNERKSMYVDGRSLEEKGKEATAATTVIRRDPSFVPQKHLDPLTNS